MGLLEDYLAAQQANYLAGRNAQLGGVSPAGTAISTPTTTTNIEPILQAMAAQIPTGGVANPLQNQYANRIATTTSPAGTTATAPQVGGLYGQITSDPATSALLAQRLQEAAVSRVLRSAGLGQLTPQPFGTASTGTEAGTGPGARGGDTSGIGAGSPNTGGVGLSAGDAVTGGFGALGPAANATSGGFTASSLGEAITGSNPNVGVEGFNASQGINPSLSSGLEGFGPTVGFGPDVSNPTALAGETPSINVGVTPSGEQVSINPSTGVVSVGGEPVGVIGGETDGGGGATGGGGYGGEGMGIGLGGVADGSSNAGIGGPAGTGAVGGAGDAGQGTGGPGEGDQFGNQYVVGGRGPPDSKRVGLTVSPGELITVTPPGDPKGRGLDDILRIMATMRRG